MPSLSTSSIRNVALVGHTEPARRRWPRRSSSAPVPSPGPAGSRGHHRLRLRARGGLPQPLASRWPWPRSRRGHQDQRDRRAGLRRLPGGHGARALGGRPGGDRGERHRRVQGQTEDAWRAAARRASPACSSSTSSTVSGPTSTGRSHRSARSSAPGSRRSSSRSDGSTIPRCGRPAGRQRHPLRHLGGAPDEGSSRCPRTWRRGRAGARATRRGHRGRRGRAHGPLLGGRGDRPSRARVGPCRGGRRAPCSPCCAVRAPPGSAWTGSPGS